MSQDNQEIRLALPSKGLLAEESLALLASAGLAVYHPNPRQYRATIPILPGLVVLFQRPGDIVVSVRDGSVDFGITGWDMVSERDGSRQVIPIHPGLGFGKCTLNVIVPEAWETTNCMDDLLALRQTLGRPLRIATKFPHLAQRFFNERGLADGEFVEAEGTLEIAPTIGYADLIADLVSTGTTLRDNRLKRLVDGEILSSQACLIGNRNGLRSRPAVLETARTLLEFIVAHLRARDTLMVFANIRGASAEEIAGRMFTRSVIGGLQGPTISPVITRTAERWFAVNLIVRKDQLAQAISELRAVGGSGVVMTPVTFIFEEEPLEYRQMIAALESR